jgi:hypothetical protein
VGETHNGLVLDGMACWRVPRWASYVRTGFKRSEWDVALVWDGYMGVGYERELFRLISAYCAFNRTLLCGGVRTCCVPSSCSKLYR